MAAICVELPALGSFGGGGQVHIFDFFGVRINKQLHNNPQRIHLKRSNNQTGCLKGNIVENQVGGWGAFPLQGQSIVGRVQAGMCWHISVSCLTRYFSINEGLFACVEGVLERGIHK